MTGVLLRERRGGFDTQTQRIEGHVKTEAETGVTCLHSKNTKYCWQSPEARRETGNRFSLRASRRNSS